MVKWEVQPVSELGTKWGFNEIYKYSLSCIYIAVIYKKFNYRQVKTCGYNTNAKQYNFRCVLITSASCKLQLSFNSTSDLEHALQIVFWSKHRN